MFWDPSTAAMALVDLAVVVLGAGMLWALSFRQPACDGPQPLASSRLIVAGIALTGAFYLIDLMAMLLLPGAIGHESARSLSDALHVKVRWLVGLFSLPLVFFGFIRVRRRLGRVADDRARRLVDSQERLEGVDRERRELEAIVETMDDGLVTIGTDGVVRRFNRAACEMFGYSADEILGRDVAVLAAGPDRERHGDYLRRYLETGEARVIGRGRNVTARRKDGSEFPAHLQVGEYGVGDTRCFAGVVHDLTELRDVEARLRQSQRLETVGRLAGGIAHDFNNLLTVILGTSESAAAAQPEGSPIRGDFAQIAETAQHAADLTRQLLAFSRRQVLHPRAIDLNAQIRRLEPLFRRTLGEAVELDFRLAAGLDPVLADPIQVEQVLVNLVVNARDATGGSGRIAVETCMAELDREAIGAGLEIEPGRYVEIAVHDDGAGMDATTRANIFEPFFTTKGPGGTGLGLATVHGIVHQSRGAILVESEPGAGSTFRVYLPRAVEAGRGRDPEPRAAGPGTTGSERILLVEDDEHVQRIAVRVLENAGYRVTRASRPSEALALFARDPDAPDLVVSDLVMPERGGRSLAAELQALRPGLRVLYISGDGHQGLAAGGALGPNEQLLEKPFTGKALRRAVRAALDRAQPD